MDRLRILTWHVHGAYLASLARIGHELVVPLRPGRPAGYGGRPAGLDPATVVEVPAEALRGERFDAILFQSSGPWLVDQHELLSEGQRRLPRLYVEHDPPREHPTDTHHPVDDPNVLLVHVTAFNALMWDSGRTPVRVIEHGVEIPAGLVATLERRRGIAVVNDLRTRGRRLGLDIFLAARERIPLDLAGLDSTALGGLGEVPHDRLAGVMAGYRFYFHPVRYTSFGMAACEAMLLGLPVVGLATTEMPTVVRDGHEGFVATDPAHLIDGMRSLLEDRELAVRMGNAARATARERFAIERFGREWTAAFTQAGARPGTPLATHRPRPRPRPGKGNAVTVAGGPDEAGSASLRSTGSTSRGTPDSEEPVAAGGGS